MLSILATFISRKFLKLYLSKLFILFRFEYIDKPGMGVQITSVYGVKAKEGFYWLPYREGESEPLGVPVTRYIMQNDDSIVFLLNY